MSDNIAVRAVGFYSIEGGYVDNVFGRTLDGQFDNAAAVEDDWNDWTTYGGRVAARWQINPDWETTASLIGQVSESRRRVGVGPGARRLQDHALHGRVRDDKWYQASLNLKGDLGFAELSATASYFDRNIKYEYDNSNYDQWRTAYYGVYLGYDLYNTNYLIGPLTTTRRRTASHTRCA